MSPLAKARLKLLFSSLLGKRLRAHLVQEERRVRGLSCGVSVCRDRFGIPRIYAEEPRDLFFGLGYATAQDRLWQMDLNRRLAFGRLSELFGDTPASVRGMPSLLRCLRLPELDLFWRALGFERVVREELKLLSPQAREVLEGFKDGVNAWMTSAFEEGTLPLEFALLGYLPDPWRAEDSLAIGKLIGWFLSLSFQADLALGLLMGEPALRRLLPTYPEEGPSVVEGRGFSPGSFFFGSGPGLGSNSFVVAGSRTTTGKPLLANDPHLFLTLPTFWYPVYLEGAGYHLAGGTTPGVPAVIVGTNGSIAWGMTNAMVDDADFYLETLQELDLYRFKDEWKRVKVVEEEIRVRGEERPRRYRLRYVEHGGVDCPLLSDVLGGKALSLRWAGFEPNRNLDALLALAQAKDLQEFQAGLQLFAVPAQNVLYADREGHIAYFLAGWIPQRMRPEDGLVPMDGSSGEHEWAGYLPFEVLPKSVDPEEGFLATANEQVAPGFPGHLFEPPYRSVRIRQLLQEKPCYSLQDLQAIQLDLLSLQAEALVKGLLAPHLDSFKGEAREAAELLLRWDPEQKAESVEASVFHVFYIKLLEKAFREKLDRRAPGLYEWYFSIFHLPVAAADQILLQQDPDFLGERPEALIEEALQEALACLKQKFGGRRSRWKWGRLHTVTLRHPLARGSGLLPRFLNWLFGLNRGPFPAPGDGMTPNLAAFPLSQPFEVVVGPTYRQVIDLEDPSRSCWVIAGGSSGDPTSPHYADQVPLWREGRYLPLRFLSPEEARREGTLLLLQPQ